MSHQMRVGVNSLGPKAEPICSSTVVSPKERSPEAPLWCPHSQRLIGQAHLCLATFAKTCTWMMFSSSPHTQNPIKLFILSVRLEVFFACTKLSVF